MMTFRLLEFLTYLCCGLSCLILGIVLLGVRNNYSGEGRAFLNVKRNVAYATFLDVFNAIVVIMLQYWKADYLLVYYFQAPLLFFFQMFMATLAALELFRCPEIKKRTVYSLLVPVCTLGLIHYVAFFVEYGLVFDVEAYYEYVQTPFARTVQLLLYAFILIEILCLGGLLTKSVVQYNKKLESYFTGNTLMSGKRLTSWLWGYFLYAILSIAQLVCFDEYWMVALMIICNILYIPFVISLINLYRLFDKLSPAFTYMDSVDFHKTVPYGRVSAIPVSDDEQSDVYNIVATSEKNSEGERQISIDSIVTEWKNRPQRQYLEEGITIADVAKSMGVSPRLLSDFLNNVYDMNFNSWINSLRISDVQAKMLAEPRLTLAELADYSGFTDASALSKAFKKVTGHTPSNFRKKNS